MKVRRKQIAIRDRVKELRRVKASELVPSPHNWRTHPRSQQDALSGVLEEIGYAGALLVRELPDGSYGIIDGHLRAETTPDMEVPVLVLDVDEREAKYLLATLDPLGAMAEANDEALAALMQDVESGNAAVQEMLAGLYAMPAPPIQEDDVPDPPADPITKPGNLWLLGDHRVLCGDSTKAKDVTRVMMDNQWNCMITDPPYGVEYEGGRNPKSNVARTKIAGDFTPGLYAAFLPVWLASRNKKGVLYLWFAGQKGASVYAAIEKCGFTVRALIIWNKIEAHYGNFMAQYMQKHEPLLYCVIEGAEWYGPTNEVTVWDIKQPTINEEHPTQKPIECMARAIRNSSKLGDLIVDPFLGSGTTLIAAEQLSRKCYGLEISPAYCDVIVKRWEQFTGKTARLECH